MNLRGATAIFTNELLRFFSTFFGSAFPSEIW